MNELQTLLQLLLHGCLLGNQLVDSRNQGRVRPVKQLLIGILLRITFNLKFQIGCIHLIVTLLELKQLSLGLLHHLPQRTNLLIPRQQTILHLLPIITEKRLHHAPKILRLLLLECHHEDLPFEKGEPTLTLQILLLQLLILLLVPLTLLLEQPDRHLVLLLETRLLGCHRLFDFGLEGLAELGLALDVRSVEVEDVVTLRLSN